MRKRCLWIALASLPAIAASDNDVMQQGYMAKYSGQYLEAERLFRSVAFDKDCGIRSQNALTSVRSMRSFISADPFFTDPQGRLTDKPLADWTATEADLAAIERAEARDALDEIAKRAAATRIVILNEHHMFPRSRAFAYQLAKRLRPLGYDVLAVETFSNNPDSAYTEAQLTRMVVDGYPRQNNGFYTADPVFGGFVRGALALGYRPAAYETTNYEKIDDPDASIARREQDQFDNLVKVLARYPQSKILIYVGFSHAAKAPIGPAGRQSLWMAARLKAMTGIDPLTIDQSTFMAASLARSDSPIFTAAQAKAQRRSVALFDGDQPLAVGHPAGAIDLVVVHPLTPVRRGRPGWLYDLERAPRRAPRTLKPATGAILVKAYAAGDADDAVPLDQVFWSAGQSAPTLLLPPGPVRYAAETVPEPICSGH